MFCLDLQLEVSNLTLNGIPIGKDSKDVTVFQHKTGKSFGQEEGVDLDGGSNASFFLVLLEKEVTNHLWSKFFILFWEGCPADPGCLKGG